eukprot:6664750-Prymnesium_polylepis.1
MNSASKSSLVENAFALWATTSTSLVGGLLSTSSSRVMKCYVTKPPASDGEQTRDDGLCDGCQDSVCARRLVLHWRGWPAGPCGGESALQSRYGSGVRRHAVLPRRDELHGRGRRDGPGGSAAAARPRCGAGASRGAELP